MKKADSSKKSALSCRQITLVNLANRPQRIEGAKIERAIGNDG